MSTAISAVLTLTLWVSRIKSRQSRRSLSFSSSSPCIRSMTLRQHSRFLRVKEVVIVLSLKFAFVIARANKQREVSTYRRVVIPRVLILLHDLLTSKLIYEHVLRHAAVPVYHRDDQLVLVMTHHFGKYALAVIRIQFAGVELQCLHVRSRWCVTQTYNHFPCQVLKLYTKQ